MLRSSTLVTSHYSSSIPPHCPLDSSSDPLRLRERSRHSHSATSLVHRQFCNQRIKQPFTPPSACLRFAPGILVTPAAHRQPPVHAYTTSGLQSHQNPKFSSHQTILSHPIASTPHFSPNQVQSLQPHCRQQQPRPLPFLSHPIAHPNSATVHKSCGICHTTLFHPQSSIFTARFLRKIHRACPPFQSRQCCLRRGI